MRHTFPDSEINQRLANSAYARDTITNLLKDPNLTYAGVTAHFLKAADRGLMPHADALRMASSLPSNPDRLRKVLEHLHQVLFHASGLLGHEQQRRAAGAPK